MAAGNASGIRAGRAYVELGADDKLSAALDNAKKKVKEFGDAASAVGAGWNCSRPSSRDAWSASGPC